MAGRDDIAGQSHEGNALFLLKDDVLWCFTPPFFQPPAESHRRTRREESDFGVALHFRDRPFEKTD
jgi:hypothetical protein